ncbi:MULTISPECIES: TetR family transcriptional regulator [Stenotrophomonas]|uniref:TetR family transcriptional regulator n=1 Tax=Stenotrophomonas maltophilia TaxID=40324 RepID=A0A3S0HDE8_STEMA|nr:TetR family transcriptional regulator [Stenotrophomonas maltophilia]RTQ87495.1 TetR family transcriptional regulator [Stenotrophomonas maltophilia]
MRSISRNSPYSLERALAATLVARPNCTLSELARSAGISRATLYRFAPTRAEIVLLLSNLGYERLEQAGGIIAAGGEQALERASEVLMDDWQLVMLVFGQIVEVQQASGELNREPERWKPIGTSFDTFFLEGQKQGLFRVELATQWITDFYWTCFYGVSWAMSRGRLAPALATQTLIDSFRSGAAVPR